VFQGIELSFGNFSSSRQVLNAWLKNFDTHDLYAQEVLEVLRRQITVGPQCQKLFTVMPITLRDYLGRYTRSIQPAEARKYHGISNECTEVFLFHHGFRMLDRGIRAPLKNKGFIDGGAFIGDSTLVLSEYAKAVYSIELSTANYAALTRVLALNPSFSANVHTFHMGVNDKEGETAFIGAGMGTKISHGPGKRISMTTIDSFVQRYNL
jgi:hypothetical protein